MRTVCLLALLACMTFPFHTTSHAVGIPVYDSLNHISNTTTSIQTAISAIQAVLQTGYWIVELTGIDGAIGTAEMMQDLVTMQALLSDTRALAWDFRSIATQVNRLFDPAGAPTSAWELSERQREIDQTLWQVYSYATAVQTLTATIIHTIDHMRKFVDRIGALIGSRQALQSLNESQTKLVESQQKQILMTAAFQQAEAYQRLQEPLTNEAIRRINDSLYSTLPRRR